MRRIFILKSPSLCPFDHYKCFSSSSQFWIDEFNAKIKNLLCVILSFPYSTMNAFQKMLNISQSSACRPFPCTGHLNAFLHFCGSAPSQPCFVSFCIWQSVMRVWILNWRRLCWKAHRSSRSIRVGKSGATITLLWWGFRRPWCSVAGPGRSWVLRWLRTSHPITDSGFCNRTKFPF